MTVITDPGVYQGLDEQTYHADPVEGGSLSQSGAKLLLESPAKFDHRRRHPAEPTAAMTLGTAAHAMVLGVGAEIVEVEFDSWRTKEAKAQQDAAIAEGKTPLLSKDVRRVEAMAEKLRSHETAGMLLQQGGGTPEASLFHRDPSGVMLRARLDRLPEPNPGGRLIIPDYKTSTSADPEAFAKSAADFGYHMQAGWYEDIVVALGLAEEAVFLFVVQEKEPPFEVSVVQLDVEALAIGRYQNRMAIEIYQQCVESGVWPGYGDEVHMVQLPVWFRRRFEGLELEGAL